MNLKLKDEYYYHGLSNYDENIMVSIIKNGILSRNLLGNMDTEIVGFNGNNYVSVCKKENIDKIDNCYELYIEGSFSIVIGSNINAKKAKKISPFEYKNHNSSNNFYSNYNDENNCERYSDLEGEYQVRDLISNSKFIAVGFPLSTLKIDMENDEIRDKYLKIKNALKESNLNIPIIDLEEVKIITEDMFKNDKKILQKRFN